MNKYINTDLTSYSLGMSLTIEALKHKTNYVEKVILSNKANKNEQLSLLISLCEKNDIEIVYDDIAIEKLSLKENCYCIGVFKKFNSELQSNKHIVLYKFNDFGELGTILRSAVSFDYKDIVLIDSEIDYFDPRCIRASMGAIFLTNIVKYGSLEEYINDYSNQEIITFVSKSNKELRQLDIKDNFSLVISQDYYELDSLSMNGYYIKHDNLNDISLSVRSSIILNYVYNLNLNR